MDTWAGDTEAGSPRAPLNTGDTRATGLARGLFRGPPGLVFHGLLVVPTMALLFFLSHPGFEPGSFLIAVYGLGIGFLVWLLRVVTYGIARARRRASGSARWLLVAPVAGLLVLGLLWADAPLRARWQLSRGAFVDAVASAPGAGDPDDRVPLAVPDRLGLYRVDHADRVGDNVIFHNSVGAFVGEAGFAYLPDGPSEASSNWENPQFTSLGGGWYAWISVW